MFRGDAHVDEWGEVAIDYLDGRLDPDTKAAVERHLHSCADCAARLRTQHQVTRLLQQTELDDPPSELQDRVLGQLLLPSRPVARVSRPATEEPGWSILWRRKIKPWIPATVAVAAVVFAIVGYAAIRSNADLSTSKSSEAVSTVAAADRTADTEAAREETLGATTVAAGAVTTTAAATSTTAGATTTTAMVVVAAAQERDMMVNALEGATTLAFFVFEEADAGTGDHQPAGSAAGLTAEQVEAVASQVGVLTGLEPLAAELSLGVPTFAAFVSRDDAAQLVDLLNSIGESAHLTVSVREGPPASADEFVARLLERETELPLLLSGRTKSSATSRDAFTTSTWTPAPGPTDESRDVVPPDEAGTHVLVVIYLED